MGFEELAHRKVDSVCVCGSCIRFSDCLCSFAHVLI